MFIKNSARRNVSWFKQLRVLTARYMNLIKNDYSRLLLLLVQPVAIALLLFLVAQEGTFVNFDDTKSILFALSCSGIWIGLFNTTGGYKRRAILKESIWEICGCPAMCCPNTLFRELFVLYSKATLLTTIFLNLLDILPKEELFGAAIRNGNLADYGAYDICFGIDGIDCIALCAQCRPAMAFATVCVNCSVIIFRSFICAR